jgi:hypothetical protein
MIRRYPTNLPLDATDISKLGRRIANRLAPQAVQISDLHHPYVRVQPSEQRKQDEVGDMEEVGDVRKS